MAPLKRLYAQPAVSCSGRSAAPLRRCAAEPGPMRQRVVWRPGSRLCAATL